MRSLRDRLRSAVRSSWPGEPRHANPGRPLLTAAAAAPLVAPALLVAAALLFAPALVAQPSRPPAQTAHAVTEPGRTLSRPLDLWLAGSGASGSAGQAAERTLLLLLDPTPALTRLGFAEAFETALLANAAALANARLGLAVVGASGADGCIVQKPTTEHGRVAAEVRSRLLHPASDFANVHADLRTAAALLQTARGERELLLVTLENGDVEDDVEQTARVLARAKVRVTVLTSEACLADSYWAARPLQEKPRGTELVGGDGPVIDLPWGWLFQQVVANEVTPAAYGPYALTRIAAVTGGRVHLVAAPGAVGHQCAFLGRCLFCSHDHLPQDEAYLGSRLEVLAPLVTSRREAQALLGRDSYARAMADAWQQAVSEGLVRGQPDLGAQTVTGGSGRRRGARALDLLTGIDLERQAKRAEQAAAAAEEIGGALEAELSRIGSGRGMPRQEAAAHLTRVMLQVTKLNLVTFAGWCREVAPLELQPASAGGVAPSPPETRPDARRGPPVGITFVSLSLCHGAAPFREVQLPGGDALRRELDRLDAMTTAFLARYDRSPYAFALHRAGIAQFFFVYGGVAGPLPRQRAKSELDGSDTATRSGTPRPPRAGSGTGSGAGAGTGPTTGGR